MNYYEGAVGPLCPAWPWQRGRQEVQEGIWQVLSAGGSQCCGSWHRARLVL